MLRPLRCLWLGCLLLVGPGLATGQDADPTKLPPSSVVTTLGRPADTAPIVSPLVVPGQAIPPVAVLTQPPATAPQSVAEEGLGRDMRVLNVSASFPAEVGLLFPVVNQNLNANVNVGGLFTTLAQLPSAPLHFTAAPTFNLRFGFRDLGEVGVSYRLLASEGTSTVVGLDPAGVASLRSRLDMQVFDLNYYATHDAGIWWGILSQLDNTNWHPSRWNVNWDVGMRLASVYFDSRALGPTIDQRVSNYYFGAGPRVGLTLTRALGESSIAFYSRLDTSAIMGAVQQRFSELAAPAGAPAAFGYTSQRMGQAVPMLNARSVSPAPICSRASASGNSATSSSNGGCSATSAHPRATSCSKVSSPAGPSTTDPDGNSASFPSPFRPRSGMLTVSPLLVRHPAGDPACSSPV